MNSVDFSLFLQLILKVWKLKIDSDEERAVIQIDNAQIHILL